MLVPHSPHVLKHDCFPNPCHTWGCILNMCGWLQFSVMQHHCKVVRKKEELTIHIAKGVGCLIWDFKYISCQGKLRHCMEVYLWITSQIMNLYVCEDCKHLLFLWSLPLHVSCLTPRSPYLLTQITKVSDYLWSLLRLSLLPWIRHMGQFARV